MLAQCWNYSLFKSVLILAPFVLLASLGMDVYLPVVPDMQAALATTPDIVQLTLSLYMLVLGSGQLVFGPLSDRLGRRPVLLAGAAVFVVASAALALVQTGPSFAVLRVVQSAGAAAALVAIFATVRDVFSERREGVAIYGLLGSLLGFVPAFGPILGAVVAQQFGWQGIFWMLAALGAVAGIQAAIWWPETRSPHHTVVRFADASAILGNPAFQVYTLGYSAALGAFFVFFSTAPHVLIDRVGMTSTNFSLAFGTVAVVMICTSRFATRSVGRWGERGCLMRGMSLLVAGAMLLALGQAYAWPSLWAFIGPMWIVAIGISITCAVAANGALRAFGHVAGTASALFGCVESVIVVVAGTAAVGMLPSDGAWPLAVFCATFGMATIGLMNFLISRKHP